MRNLFAIILTVVVSHLAFAQSDANDKLPVLQYTEVIQGTSNDLGSWGDGYVYIIELWGTWCAPCIKNMPTLSNIYSKYKSKGLRVVGYSWENPDNVKKMVLKMGEKANYIFVNDTKERFLKIVAEQREMVESFPFSFVVDEKGNLVWSGNPSAGLESFVDQLFKND